VLSLDTVGGVESLYMHYLVDALARGSAIHYTCISGKYPHPAFTNALEKLNHKPFLEQYIMGLRLPRFLHSLIHIRRGMIEDLVSPSAWVYWNRIEDKGPPGTAIYYEHGASWSLPVTKARKQFLKNASLFLANSHAATIMLREKWGVKSPISIVPNPLRPDISVSIPRKAPKSHELRLGYIGRLVPIKGSFVALHTLKELLDRRIPTTLQLAGVGDLETDLHKCAARLGVSKSVIWRGSVQNVCDFYDNVDMLIVPSIREPLGLVALEAAARGVPVIASRIDGLPEVVIDGVTGVCISPSIELNNAKGLLSSRRGLPNVVVDPISQTLVTPKLIDPASCADAIAKLWYNPEQYALLSSQAVELARGRADFCSYTASLRTFLEQNPQPAVDSVDGIVES
jgi:glycosyltransferase involved in cell wall biosynthesis